MPQPQGKDMRLRILACRQVYSGKNQLGHEYTIYEVDAAKEDGTVISEKLRSFSSLPIAQVVEVTVTPFASDRYGRSFTLHPKGGRSEGATAQLNELREEVAKLSAFIQSLTIRVQELEGLAAGRRGDAKPAEPASPSPQEAALDSAFGATPPW